MKASRSTRILAGLLLLGVMTAAIESYARPPRQHPVRGVIESIDGERHTLVIAEPKTKARQVFIWDRATWFRHSGVKATAQSLSVGTAVKGYYRKEIGRFVLREVGVSSCHDAQSS